MYNLDINFLRDRNPEQSASISSDFAQKKEASIADKIPIALGALVFLLAPAIVFGYLKNVNAKTATLKQEIQQIEAEIADLGNQNKKIESVNQEIQQVQQETAALVGVFEKIKPWAAIMQEVSDRTPPGISVESLQQSGSGTGTGINIDGVARTYEDVNDFVLFLQRSPFFNAKQIKLNGASVTEFGLEVENEDALPDNASLLIPEGIKFTISAQLNNVPSSQLKEDIEEKGSVGLVTRLETLESKGVTLK
ncbi:MAG: PilN domain-containing protein [Cyanobacteria bacterium P01_G01_bin.39]